MSKRPLDQTVEREVAALLDALPDRVRREFPDISPIKTFHKLHGGYANLVYELNEHYILRVFFRTGWEANYRAERTALGRLVAVPKVPRIVSSGIFALEWPCPYLLLNRLPGTNAFSLWQHAPASVRVNWATGIAAILKQVHTVSLPHYGPLMGADEPVHSWLDFQDKKMATILTTLRSQQLTEGIHRLVDEAEAYFTAHRHTLQFQVGPRLVHGDVRLHNIIVAGEDLTGIIDWEWAHGGEPDEDLINLIRFTLFPDHEASGEDTKTARAEYASLLSLLLSAYPALAAVPDLLLRLTIYLIQADLGQLCVRSEVIQRNAEIRLVEWLRESLLSNSLKG